jgi:hypothetical protein
LSGYFSSKLEARVDIKRINFSIMGNLSIEELMVWDPRQNKILSVREMTVTTRLSHLITGELTFEEIHVAGVDATLIRNEDGLNIQYIIDAFFKPTGDTDTTSSTPINLRFKNILLEEIVFTSTVNGVTTAANLGTLRSRGVEFSTRPNKIIVDEISLDKTAVNVLSTWRQDMDDNCFITTPIRRVTRTMTVAKLSLPRPICSTPLRRCRLPPLTPAASNWLPVFAWCRSATLW